MRACSHCLIFKCSNVVCMLNVLTPICVYQRPYPIGLILLLMEPLEICCLCSVKKRECLLNFITAVSNEHQILQMYHAIHSSVGTEFGKENTGHNR